MYHIQTVGGGGTRDKKLHGAICQPLFSCKRSVICTHTPWSNTSVCGLRTVQLHSFTHLTHHATRHVSFVNSSRHRIGISGFP